MRALKSQTVPHHICISHVFPFPDKWGRGSHRPLPPSSVVTLLVKMSSSRRSYTSSSKVRSFPSSSTSGEIHTFPRFFFFSFFTCFSQKISVLKASEPSNFHTLRLQSFKLAITRDFNRKIAKIYILPNYSLIFVRFSLVWTVRSMRTCCKCISIDLSQNLVCLFCPVMCFV